LFWVFPPHYPHLSLCHPVHSLSVSHYAILFLGMVSHTNINHTGYCFRAAP
jgi:hypothetical protein